MSQQTTMAVVVPRFTEFMRVLPDVDSLARVSDATLRELWAGLGYYARARNLRAAAQYIVYDCKGIFPQTFEDWLRVPGVGPYTASVIVSICFQVPKGCVDGNVLRVVARLTDCRTSELWTETGRKAVQSFVDVVLPHERPGDFNQAMMELGATVCQKQNPSCGNCPASSFCLSYRNESTGSCPTPKPRKAFLDIRLVALHLVWESQDDERRTRTLLIERTEGFLSGTVGFPLLRVGDDFSPHNFLVQLHDAKEVREAIWQTGDISHTITRHRLQVHSLTVHLNHLWASEKQAERLAADLLKRYSISAEEFVWVSKSQVRESLATSLDRKVWEKMT